MWWEQLNYRSRLKYNFKNTVLVISNGDRKFLRVYKKVYVEITKFRRNVEERRSLYDEHVKDESPRAFFLRLKRFQFDYFLDIRSISNSGGPII